MYSDRNFMIFSVTELDKIDFSEVLETSAETVRKSIDGSKTFVKWQGSQIPASVESLSTKQGPFGYEEILEILIGQEWTAPINNEMPNETPS